MLGLLLLGRWVSNNDAGRISTQSPADSCLAALIPYAMLLHIHMKLLWVIIRRPDPFIVFNFEAVQLHSDSG